MREYRIRKADLPVFNPLLTAPDNVSTLVLAANTAETLTKPTGANIVVFKATADSYVTYIETGEDTDLATNGALASDTGWTKGTGWTIGAGVASSDASQAGDSDLEQDGGVVEGKAYRVTFTVSGYSAGNVTAVLGGTEGTDRGADGTFTETIVAGSDGVIALRADANFAGSVDNISVAPIAHVPAADQTTGYASELIPSGVEVARDIRSVARISVVSAGTPKFNMAFYA